MHANDKQFSTCLQIESTSLFFLFRTCVRRSVFRCQKVFNMNRSQFRVGRKSHRWPSEFLVILFTKFFVGSCHRSTKTHFRATTKWIRSDHVSPYFFEHTVRKCSQQVRSLNRRLLFVLIAPMHSPALRFLFIRLSASHSDDSLPKYFGIICSTQCLFLSC